ncbi:MAG: VanZ family protein [Chloroflexota bacterium]
MLSPQRAGTATARSLFLHWGPVVLWMLVIFSLSSRSDIPARTSAATGEIIRATFAMAKLVHVIEYGTLGLLLWRALTSPGGGVSLVAGRAILACALIALCYGALDEVRQSFVPGREPRVFDVGLDTLSAFLAAVTMWRISRRRLVRVHAGG